MGYDAILETEKHLRSGEERQISAGVCVAPIYCCIDVVAPAGSGRLDKMTATVLSVAD